MPKHTSKHGESSQSQLKVTVITSTIRGSSTQHSITSLVGTQSRGQDFLEGDVIRSYTTDLDRRLNSEKEEPVMVLPVPLIQEEWTCSAISNLIALILSMKNLPKLLACCAFVAGLDNNQNSFSDKKWSWFYPHRMLSFLHNCRSQVLLCSFGFPTSLSTAFTIIERVWCGL